MLLSHNPLHVHADRVAGARLRSGAPRARIDWRCIDVPFLTAEDVESLAAVLRRHVAASAIEAMERRHAALMGQAWAPLVVEIDGRRRDGFDLGLLADPHADGFHLRTFGHAAAVNVDRAAVRVVVDDEPALARRTAAAIRRLLRPRRRRALGLLASDWLAPASAFLVPVAASLLDAPGDPGPATWAGLAAAALLIAAWGWWRNRVWLTRRLVVGAAAAGPAAELPMRSATLPLPAGSGRATAPSDAPAIDRAAPARVETGTSP